MRWSNLTLEDGEAEQRMLPGYRDPAVVRRFDAPEALDIRFHEVRAKSALNKVPDASRMPFRWTVNPYRGCTHACSYCLSGETQVLRADGRTNRMAELEIGDEIYGTERAGSYRRYVATRVLDKWSSIKPAFAVTLDDGTELVASGDHRFLSERGWKHVTGNEQRPGGRPHLTAGNRLLGPGGGSCMKSTVARRVTKVRPLGMVIRLYDITTGTGDFIANGVISHNCFARPTHKFLDFDAGRDFEREIVVKVNAPEVLRAELARPSWKGEHVALGTNTDPYQWVEARYRITRGLLEALRDAHNPCSVLTKSPLLLRDLDVMVEVAERGGFSACLSIPTLDEKTWRATEPHTPSPRARLEAVAELNRAGIPTGVLIAPLMPGINDAPHQVEPLLELAEQAGATSIGGVALHMRGEVREVFMGWLEDARPDLVPRYRELYRRGAYVPVEDRRRMARMVRRGEGPGSFRSMGDRGRLEFGHDHDRPPSVAQLPRQQTLF